MFAGLASALPVSFILPVNLSRQLALYPWFCMF